MIELNPQEEQLKTLLSDVAKWIDTTNTEVPEKGQTLAPLELQKQPIVLRFTGGWVRDKLLGVESHDIDVAVNNMTGYQFGLKLKEYLDIPEVASKYGVDGSTAAGGLHKIEANPEKSKHLETVTTKILGMDIDLVNLRKETYTEDSRNPEMEFGTPEEDALRRDACVNALFYNLNTGEVEDFTKRGLNDMKNKLIRTPLEPYQTFKDDPLRVLRLIRFATRLGYAIDPAAQESMGHQDIKDALRVKISRERVGIELEKMLRGRDPHGALQWIEKLGLYTTVFTDPVTSPTYQPDLQHWPIVYGYTLKLTILSSTEQQSFAAKILSTPDERYQAWISAALIPWADAPLPPPPKKNRQPIPLVVSVAQEGFKAPNKVSNFLAASMQHLNEIRALVDKFNSHLKFPNRRQEGDDATAPDTIGMAIRRWGATWKQQVLFALLYEIFNRPDSLKSTERAYASFIDHVAAADLLEAHDMKPLIDGNALRKALNISPGPWMKEALDVVIAWQMRNPGIKNPEQAIEAVKTHLGESSNGTGLPNAALELRNALISYFLRDAVRPLFTATPSNPSLTPAGRQRIVPKVQRTEFISEEESNRPWKRDPHVLVLLQWAVNALTPPSVELHWPQLIPPILALIDDLDTTYKILGCTLLRILLQRTPPSLLKRTGLTGVFEEALTPLLSHLPTLNSAADSVRLLDAVYPCLIQLARTRWPVASRVDDAPAWDEKVKMTTKYIRHGVLHGMAMAGEYPPVAACLLTHLKALLDEERIDSVRHLKEVVPVLVGVLSEPFALANVPLLLAAVRALQAVILNGWPRMEGWKGEILKGLCLLWVRIEEEGREKSGVAELEADMRATVQMLDAALKKSGSSGLATHAATLIEADDTLAGLFQSL